MKRMMQQLVADAESAELEVRELRDAFQAFVPEITRVHNGAVAVSQHMMPVQPVTDALTKASSDLHRLRGLV